MTEFAAIPWGDPGVGGPAGADPTGVSGGSGTTSIPGVRGGISPGLDPLGGQIPREVDAAGGLAGIWEEIKGRSAVAGVYLLLASLFLIGVAALFFGSPAGQIVMRAAGAEVTGGASEAGRAAGRIITRRKKPKKQPAKS